MSPILLDTHAAIWAAEGALPLSAAKVVEAAALKGELMLSPITAWEIGVRVGKGRLTLAVTAQQFVRAMFIKRGVLIAH